MKVYLCGPINGCTDEECKDWREEAKNQFPNAIDPMVRDYRGREDECYKEIVQGDKLDVLRSDIVLVNYDRPSVGTAMEIFFAYQNRVPVIVVAKEGTKISPWLRYHTYEIVSSFSAAFRRIESL